MRHTLYILTFSLLMTSCATLTKKLRYEMDIYASVENVKVEIDESIYQLPATVEVTRSKNDLDIKVITDTTTFDCTIKSSVNPAFLLGNLLWMYVAPGAYLIDLTNQKRFYYGNTVYLNFSDSVRIIRPPVSKFFHDYISTTYPTHKGEFYLHLSLPHINSFHFKPENEETKFNTGFWGLSLGLGYCYAKNKYFNLGISGASDFFVPVPAAVDISGEYEMMSTRYISFSNNHKLGRFTLGYGLSYTRNSWDFRFYDRFDPPPPTREPIKRSHNAFGMVLPAYFQFGKHFHLGVIYRPTFLSLNVTDKFKYEHLISIDFAWKIRLNE